MKRLIWDAGAQADILSSASWYEQQRPDWGVRFVSAIAQAGEKLPEVVSHRRHHMHSGVFVASVSGYAQRLVYVVQEDAIVIVAVAHPSRDPDYWLKRLP